MSKLKYADDFVIVTRLQDNKTRHSPDLQPWVLFFVLVCVDCNVCRDGCFAFYCRPSLPTGTNNPRVIEVFVPL